MILAFYGLVAACLFVSELSAPMNGWLDEQFTSQSAPAISNASYSTSSRSDALKSCDAALAEPFSSLQPTDQRQVIATHCLNLSQKILNETPTLSLAYYVAALSSYHLGDTAAGRKHMLNSQKFGPYEGWLAERRFMFIAHQHCAGFAELALSDIRTMLTTQSGAEILARFFQARPELRDAIKIAAGQSFARNQQRFLNLVRRLESGL